MNEITNKIRNSNFELLRIFGMTSIILCHFLMGINSYIMTKPDTSFYYFSLFFYGWTGAFGNIIFMLISGYFLCTSDFNIKKIIKLWFNIFSVSVLIGLVFYIFKIPSQDFSLLKSSDFFSDAVPITKIDLLKCFAPTVLGHTWYASKYLVFLLFTPFCKLLLEKLCRKTHFYLCILLFVLGTVTKMIPAQRLYDPSNLFYFFLAYYIASYIRLYEPDFFSHARRNIILAAVAILIIGIWNIFLSLFINSHIELEQYKRFFYLTKIHMFPIWIAALFIFNFFRIIHIKNSPLINFIASSTFDAYLLHCNFIFSGMLWCGILQLPFLIKSFCPFFSLFVIPGVFIISIIFHFLRIKFVEKPFIFIINKLIQNKTK